MFDLIRPNDKPWMTGRIRSKIRKRNRLFKKCKFDLCNDSKKLRNSIVNEIKGAKEKYMKSISDKFDDKKCGQLINS